MRYRIYMTPVGFTPAGARAGRLWDGCRHAPPETQAPASGEPEAIEVPSSNWSQLLSRDSIRPIYDPEFVPAHESGYDDNELMVGVALEGEAKAYPISMLNAREMVNDELGSVLLLVTW